MRVIACGSRTFSDSDVIDNVLLGFACQAWAWNETFVLIQGGAKGADKLADEWAACENGYSVERLQFDAKWDEHGKAAGPIRNGRMLDEGRPDLVIAFVDKPLAESKGTAHMVRIAREAGVKTIVVEAW